jgi:hypothetical protein
MCRHVVLKHVVLLQDIEHVSALQVDHEHIVLKICDLGYWNGPVPNAARGAAIFATMYHKHPLNCCLNLCHTLHLLEIVPCQYPHTFYACTLNRLLIALLSLHSECSLL